MKYKLFVDMDGVLVDFDKGYEQLTGVDISKMSFQTGPKFWNPIDKAGSDFWANLEWMEDGKKLWKFISPYKPTILSAPSKKQSSKIGKTKWVDRELKNVSLLLVPAHAKKNFSGPNNILIDDRGINCDQWIESGGIAIYHSNADDTINQLIKIIFNEQ